MPGARWFEGARFNYAEHALRAAGGRGPRSRSSPQRQTRERVEITWAELAEQVARARAGLQRLGVGSGDRVAAYLPNIPETIVGFLAACSLGAIWTSCAPEFGVQAVLDRFTQVEPTVLLAVEGYRYGRHTVSTGWTSWRRSAPGCRACGTPWSYPHPDAPVSAPGVMPWAELTPSPRRWRSSRWPPTIRCTSCTRRGRPGCRSRSCTGTAVCCSST
jgi:acetoacetyl-CoA synthetase